MSGPGKVVHVLSISTINFKTDQHILVKTVAILSWAHGKGADEYEEKATVSFRILHIRVAGRKMAPDEATFLSLLLFI